MRMMKGLIWVQLMLIAIFSVNLAGAQDVGHINDFLEQMNIAPQMASYHPDGEWFISGKTDDGNKFSLLRIYQLQAEQPKMDTLRFGYYQNISKLSNDGDELLYGFLDTIPEPTRKVSLRTYEKGKFGEPKNFLKESGLQSLTYFMVTDKGGVYFYSYDFAPKGLYKIEKTKKGYTVPTLLIANRANHVPFSPLLLDDDTMILAQHGKEDKSVNGIYVSKRTPKGWSEPLLLEGLPYGWSLGFGKHGSIVYVLAKERKIKKVAIEEIKAKIREAIKDKTTITQQ